MKLTLSLAILLLLCGYEEVTAHEGCTSSIPMVEIREVLQDEDKLSLHNKIDASEVSQESIRLAKKDANHSGLNIEYMYAIRVADEPGHFLIFVDLRKDESYIAYRVLSSNTKPVYKFAFYYMFMSGVSTPFPNKGAGVNIRLNSPSPASKPRQARGLLLLATKSASRENRGQSTF